MKFESEGKAEQQSEILKGMTIVISGNFSISRDEMKARIVANGGKSSGSISGKTTYLLAGEKAGPEKLKKAESLGVKVISETEFREEILRSAQDDRERELNGREDDSMGRMKVIKPAAGYSSCPDHTLKGDIIDMLSGKYNLGIKLTESYAMIPEASICGFIFMHPQAKYPEIRKISQAEVEAYAQRRGMDTKTADRFLSHLLK